ncbi:hypothetical protein FOZ60_006563 [Perkinsus olseni]|uniref:Uncharacterized protein n=1 Tax=Perkinsus olseni TaxID=32597 RepID=A0A7J6NPN4_PEROL|nr:hypothetical protein FOZ60_006563 [Perkinsus olseni]
MSVIRLTPAALPLIKALDSEMRKEHPSIAALDSLLKSLNGSMGWNRWVQPEAPAGRAPPPWDLSLVGPYTPSRWRSSSSDYQLMKSRLVFGCPFEEPDVAAEVAGLLFPWVQETIGLMQVCCGLDTVILPPLDYSALRSDEGGPLLEAFSHGIWIPSKNLYFCAACGTAVPTRGGPPNLGNLLVSAATPPGYKFEGPTAFDLADLLEAFKKHVQESPYHTQGVRSYTQRNACGEYNYTGLKDFPFCFVDHPYFKSGITAQALLDHLNWHRLPPPVHALGQALWYHVRNGGDLGIYVHSRMGRLIVWRLCTDREYRSGLSMSSAFELRKGTCPFDAYVQESVQALIDFVYVPAPRRFPPPPAPAATAKMPPVRPLMTTAMRSRRGGMKGSVVVGDGNSGIGRAPGLHDDGPRFESGSTESPVCEVVESAPSGLPTGRLDIEGLVLSSSLTTGEWSPRTKALYDVLKEKYGSSRELWEPWFAAEPTPVPLVDQSTIYDICNANHLLLPSGFLRSTGDEMQVPGQSSSSSSIPAEQPQDS